MSLFDEIILKLYYPQYENRSSSRFETFFKSLPTKNKISINSNNKKIETNIIYPERIIQSIDKRSSIVFKKVPKEMTKNFLRTIIESFGNINYLYIYYSNINLFKTVYVNFINYKSIVPIYMFLRRVKSKSKTQIEIVESKFLNVEMYYSEIQGKENLKNYFQDDDNDK